MISSRLSLAARKVMAVQRRNCVHYPEGYKGANFFFDITNKRLFTVKAILFLAVPYWLPFLVVRHQLRKSSGQI